MHALEFQEIARLPAPGDNVAIAATRLEAGTRVRLGAAELVTDYTILEGHRFAIATIDAGAPLLSWGLPFGYALHPIRAGAYVCNAKMLAALAGRAIDFPLPATPNFRDHPLTPYQLDEGAFRPGAAPPRYDDTRHFLGYRRGANRGVGTRNYLVVLGTTSGASGLARAIEERFRDVPARYPNIDGVVAVTHTEGGTARANNRELVLRTLAGFAVHPNVAAMLALDPGGGAVSNDELRQYLDRRDYPRDELLLHFATPGESFAATVDAGAALVESWLPTVNGCVRAAQPLAELKLGLQCGGSDAFSGISGNPLAAWVAHELVRYGGAANLAETDELIGAEAYLLANVRDIATARRFLATVERFKELVGRHGHTAEGNPSGGNNFRGLYNIALKSLGAAMKRHPDTRLEYVIDYAERMTQPGYYFMDSPGNDLESIAGQVAAGSNLLYFVTGNGSITNFPFVPTIKIVTTTRRFELLQRDMDVNAGAYLDGTPMDELGRQLLERTIGAASGERTAGERAGHAQVSIWRDWSRTSRRGLPQLLSRPEPRGEPLPLALVTPRPALTFPAFRAPDGVRATIDRLGLVLPTSLCSGQIARQIAGRLNEHAVGGGVVSRFVALPHTEGCGASSGASEVLFTRTLLGYLTHPLVYRGLLLEHGCEKTHNDYFRQELSKRDLDAGQFGWASIQLDGGIGRVADRVEEWFTAALRDAPDTPPFAVGVEGLRLGLAAPGPVSPALALALAGLTAGVAGHGGTVVLASNATVASGAGASAYLQPLLGRPAAEPSLAYGQTTPRAGFYIMETPSSHWVETLTGLGATGVDLLLAVANERPVQGHRMVPLVQVAEAGAPSAAFSADLDAVLDGGTGALPQLWRLIEAVASRRHLPRARALRNTDFQMTRGLLGVSM